MISRTKSGNVIRRQNIEYPLVSGRNNRKRKENSSNSLYLLLVGIAFLLSAWSLRVQSIISQNQTVVDVLPSWDQRRSTQEVTATSGSAATPVIPEGFSAIYDRSVEQQQSCQALSDASFDNRTELPFQNGTVATLPSFGVLHDVKTYFQTPASRNAPQCQLPPLHACNVTHLTVVFMAYNPDRLKMTANEINKLLRYTDLVAKVILVWNGERAVNESSHGEWMEKTERVHVVYPLRQGLPNDLMNRYHPKVLGSAEPTEALLYYDDDGPFYSREALQSALELWKRHPRSQVGGMARQLTYSPRQLQERIDLTGAETNTGKHAKNRKAKPDDTKFVSHCSNVKDEVEYDFRFFANYDANMVLPSGSILHRNYLCFLWHPAFHRLRQFVLDHPVHPDDVTVSLVVSQLSGLAPRVYSRRLRAPEAAPAAAASQHRRLLFSICWDCGSGMSDKKQIWADLRKTAVNAVTQYFGSLNSGSIGWCAEDSPHYTPSTSGRCDPLMAQQGWLPWMQADGSPQPTCP